MALPFLSELSSILFGLPFSDKKRLVESVISPESGETDMPITDQDPIVDLRFDLDVDRVGKNNQWHLKTIIIRHRF